MSPRHFITSLVLITVLVGAAIAPAQPVEAATCRQWHTVQSGETLYRIARAYGTTVSNLQTINGLGSSTRIYAGSSLCVSLNANDGGNVGGTSYTVQRGDTLSQIARRFGVRMDVLARVNNISNPNRIYVGQVISIPDFTIQ